MISSMVTGIRMGLGIRMILCTVVGMRMRIGLGIGI